MMSKPILFSLLISVTMTAIVSARPEPLPMFLVNRSIKTIDINKDAKEPVSKKDTVEIVLKNPSEMKDPTSTKLMDSIENIPIELISVNQSPSHDSMQDKEETSLTGTNDVINLETTSSNTGKSSLEVDDGKGHHHVLVKKVDKKKTLLKKNQKPHKKTNKHQTAHFDSLIDALLDTLFDANNDDFEDVFDVPRGLPMIRF